MTGPIDIGTTTLKCGAITTSGQETITDNTASTSTSTGALVVSGGVGLSGDLYAGGLTSSSLSLPGYIRKTVVKDNWIPWSTTPAVNGATLAVFRMYKSSVNDFVFFSCLVQGLLVSNTNNGGPIAGASFQLRPYIQNSVITIPGLLPLSGTVVGGNNTTLYFDFSPVQSGNTLTYTLKVSATNTAGGTSWAVSSLYFNAETVNSDILTLA